MKRYLVLLLIAVLFGCAQHQPQYTSYVDPFIGTDGHGHTYPGVSLPFGMVQLSPDTRKDSWDGCSGYHYTDNTILGFSHTHLSGTGIGDYGDIRIMPLTGELKLVPGTEDNTSSGYRSKFSHSAEQASPGYYSVLLEDYGILAELTGSLRCGFHQYTIPQDQPAHVILDLFESVTSDIILDSYIEIINDREIKGFRRTKGWAADQVVYFHAYFSHPFDGSGVSLDGKLLDNKQSARGENIQAYVSYYKRNWKKLKIKVGISAVSMEGAEQNLIKEIPNWDFKENAKKANELWEKELSKIKVKSGSEEDLVKFYTALYHTFLAPNTYSDADGRYLGHDNEIHQSEEHDIYTVFSLWDTYRALHPLLTVVQPQKTNDFIYTLLDIYDRSGLLPVWELAGNETFCMIGYHSIPVIADAATKGYSGFDYEHAFEAMKSSAEQDHFGLEAYRKYGYIPSDVEGESVSKTLEYAYDDWCIAMMAKLLGEDEDYNTYIRRAQYYKNLYDPETDFIRGKKNSSFIEPFDPVEVNFMLTEANTWQYTFYVPQDISGLMNLMGGPEAFTEKLDELFSTSSDLTGRQQADITGLIGQYAHGNEPSHHVTYLYNYAGKPYRTQELVRKIMDDLYGTAPSGLCGNEDCGQMSAWFVMSAMGFYPVTPGEGKYVIGSPLFDEVSIECEGNKKFTIKAINNSEKNIYINSATLNGSEFTRSFITHEEIVSGGHLEFTMGEHPNREWGSKPADRPSSEIVDGKISPVPFYNHPGKVFRGEMELTINHVDPEADIHYSFNNPPSRIKFKTYEDTIRRSNSFHIAAWVEEENNLPGMMATASYRKMQNKWSVRLKYPYSSQYTGGGDLALVDGEKGGEDFHTGGWQGYHGTDFEALIDLGGDLYFSSVTARFLSDQNAWIFLPEEVEISVSDKPYDFKVVALINNSLEESGKAYVREFRRKGLPVKARYVKVEAKNIGTCPEWHKGAGGKAWLFIDEIEIE